MEQYLFLNNNVVVNRLKQKGAAYKLDKEYEYDVATNTTIFYKVSRDEDAGPLRALDFAILDAVYYIYFNFSIYRNQFAISNLIRVLTGETTSSISKQRIEKYNSAIERLMKTRISIDYTQEYELRNDGEKNEDAKIVERPLLQLEKIGKNKYRITAMPPLYEYSEINKQIRAIPSELFYAKELKKRNTDRSILIKYYIIHEIEVMKYRRSVKYSNNKMKNYDINTIHYFIKNIHKKDCDRGLLTQIDWTPNEDDEDDTIFVRYPVQLNEHITTSSGLHTIKDVTETTRAYLQFLKKHKYIKDFSEKKRSDSGSVIGFSINL